MTSRKRGKGRDQKGSEKKSKQCVSWTSTEKVRKAAKRLKEVGSRREGDKQERKRRGERS